VTIVFLFSVLVTSGIAWYAGQQALAKRLRKLTPERAMEELLEIPP